jgi:hypothetical protein
MSFRRRFGLHQRSIIVNGILAVIVLIVILQLWLLTATMSAFLGGDMRVVWPSAFASLACLGLNVGLLVYLVRMER